MSLISQIESLLFAASAPLSARQLARACAVKTAEVEKSLQSLAEHYRRRADAGLALIRAGDGYQLATNPDNGALVSDWQKNELNSDLTPAALEALTIIAYRGPVSRAELEQIRGVNCALILRNLRWRGLVEPKEEQGIERWQVTVEFIRFLGVSSVEELPDYENLHTHEIWREALKESGQ